MAAGRLILVASRRLVALGAPFPWSIFITHVIKVLSLCIGFTRGRGPLIRPRIRLYVRLKFRGPGDEVSIAHSRAYPQVNCT